MTTSKVIIFVSYLCAVSLTLVVIIGSFLGYDMGNVTTIAALSWGEVAASNVFYFRKAGCENVLKIAQPLIQEGKIEPAEALRQALNQ